MLLNISEWNYGFSKVDDLASRSRSGTISDHPARFVVAQQKTQPEGK